ncbi:sulfatase family protein [Nocardioides bizhenqiangii]|uniref:Sulfatase n=1 Tax=Nocardioides bizhenqiangii TaxID=3095076 RepID=A0ABZ0ZP38_9ACTN|nr:sulfatase [Nocardioides sp. HM61]WQQ25579.1 sulfatase [Nocardioides sp. HM61]
MSGTRGAFVAVLLATVAVLTSAPAVVRDPSSSAPTEMNRAGRPNVVVILTDDMRADELRFLPKTRRLLVNQGVRFSNAISPHPMCCPARAELVTGQYGQNNGVRHNTGRWGGAKRLRNPDNNIGRWLQAAGYRTSYHGKFLNGYERLRPRQKPAGWTLWDAQMGGIYSYRWGRFFNGDRVRNEYVTDTMTERTDDAFRMFAVGRAPFFTVINHVAPHVALTRPYLPRWQRKYDDAYRGVRPTSFGAPSFNEQRIGDLPRGLRMPKVSRARVAALFHARVRSLRSVDDAVAATVARLDRLGELANTYIVFTSDNGYALGEHRLSSKNFLFDEVLDVPLVVRGPGFAPGTVDQTPVSLVDLVASIVDWAGATPGRRLDGVSIDRLRDDDRRPARDTILVQTGDRRPDDTPGWDYRGVTTTRYLFGHRAGKPGTGILFDRRRDPYALHNRFWDRDYRAIRRALTHRTRVLSRCAGSGCNRVFGRLPQPR